MSDDDLYKYNMSCRFIQIRAGAGELRQPQGGAGGNASAAIDNRINLLITHLDRTG